MPSWPVLLTTTSAPLTVVPLIPAIKVFFCVPWMPMRMVLDLSRKVGDSGGDCPNFDIVAAGYDVVSPLGAKANVVAARGVVLEGLESAGGIEVARGVAGESVESKRTVVKARRIARQRIRPKCCVCLGDGGGSPYKRAQ